MYCEYVSDALVSQHAERMNCTTLSSAACLAVLHYCTLSQRWHNYQGKKLLNIKVCFGILYNFYLKHFSVQQFSEILS